MPASSPPEPAPRAPAKPPGKRVEKRRRDVRAIVDASRGLAEEGGIEAVRLRDVAPAAGVSMGALYRCFESKEEILLYAFAEDFTRLEQRTAARPPKGDDPLDRLESFFRTATRGIVQRPRYGRAVIAATASGQPGAIRQMATLHARMGQLIRRVIVGDAEGGGLAGVDDETLVIASQALNRVWFSALVAWAGGLEAIDEVVVDMRRTAALLLAGALAQGTQGTKPEAP